MNHLQRVTERVTRLGHPDDESTPRPLLTLSEFFDGNEHVGSIGCNLACTPTPSEMRAALQSIADREDVVDVRVMISLFDVPEWPFSDTAYVFTTAAPADVLTWFPDALRPDEAFDGFDAVRTCEPYTIPEGSRPVACWWD